MEEVNCSCICRFCTDNGVVRHIEGIGLAVIGLEKMAMTIASIRRHVVRLVTGMADCWEVMQIGDIAV